MHARHVEMGLRRKRKVVIVGAGLAGSVLASLLSEDHEVVVVESRETPSLDGPVLRDTGYPSNSEFFCGFGPGGSTAFWHNGLIEPPREVVDDFPQDWGDLERYMEHAHRLLSGVEIGKVRASAQEHASSLVEKGFRRASLGSALYYPNQRINVWRRLAHGRVPLVIGDAIELVSKEAGRVQGVRVATKKGEVLVEGDTFVLSGGGLMSPLLLARSNLGQATAMAGLNYEDHPMGFVGEVELTNGIADLWNRREKDLQGFLRIPIVLRMDGLQIAFYLRPAIDFRLFKRRQKFRSALSDARNDPNYFRKALRLFSSLNDVVELAAIKYGLHIPSKRFSILMFAEQPCDSRIHGQYQDGKWHISRDWHISAQYLDKLEKTIASDLPSSGPFKSFTFYPGWRENLKSGGHHSGTCRPGKSAEDSVCDAEGRVWGVENLFVCDGSFVPRSGYCNTGLLIASLAAKLADTIRH